MTRFPVLRLSVNSWKYCPKKAEKKQFKGKVVWSINEFEQKNNASRDELEKSLDEFISKAKGIV